MTPPLRPWTAKVLELLADGEWHHREQLVAAAARTVPPGIAYRAGERQRRKAHGTRPDHRTRGTQETAAAAGARSKATESLATLTRSGHITRDGDRYRLTPGA